MGLLDRASVAEKPPAPAAGAPAVRGLLRKSAVLHDDTSIEGQIRRCMDLEGGAAFIVLKGKTAGAQFNADVSRAVSLLGHVIPLPRFCLVLLPKKLDRELIGHRLANSLDAEIPLSFDADTAAEAIKQLASCL